MNNFLIYFTIVIIISFIISCGGKNPSPDLNSNQSENVTQQTDILSVFNDTVKTVETEPFYKIEKSLEDIQKEVELLREKVMKYEKKFPERNYTKQLKELIDKPPAAHNISLKNGSIIEGTIEKNKFDYLLVDTDLGKLTINKSEIERIDDLILPTPDVIFIGHGQEEVFESYRLFTGKVMNQGRRRGDFVRVIYNLWGENTQLIGSDSSFVDGTQVVYHSGIVADTVLEPNQSAQFKVKISIPDSIIVTYITRDVRWALFD